MERFEPVIVVTLRGKAAEGLKQNANLSPIDVACYMHNGGRFVFYFGAYNL